jgi:hypothetical protein
VHVLKRAPEARCFGSFYLIQLSEVLKRPQIAQMPQINKLITATEAAIQLDYAETMRLPIAALAAVIQTNPRECAADNLRNLCNLW